MTLLAAACTLAAAAMFGCGDAIEHHVVSELDHDPLSRRGVLRRIWRSRRWLLGLALSTGAWVFFAASLALGGLLFVQPLIATGVLIALAVDARLTHTHLGRRAWLMALLLCAALSVFLVEAAPGGGRNDAPIRDWVQTCGPFVVVIIVGVICAQYTSGHLRAAILGTAAGAILGINGALSKVLVNQVGHGVPYAVMHWDVYALALFSFLALAIIQTAFASGSLAASLPAVQVLEPLVASFFAVALLHEHISGATTTANVLIGISIAAMIVSVVELARLTARMRVPDAPLLNQVAEPA